MATKAQVEANRKNAEKSTGPVTADGKARVRKNATRHGLCATVALQSDEDREEFDLLLADLRAEHRPDGPTQDILVFRMAEHVWFAWRSSILLAHQLDLNWAENNSQQVSLMMRYHNTSDRGFLKNLNELRKLQKESRLQEIGFVSQNPQPQPETPPEPAAQPSTRPSVVVELPSPPPLSDGIYEISDPGGLVSNPPCASGS